jgi:MOSC domain-containing protein YiiM
MSPESALDAAPRIVSITYKPPDVEQKPENRFARVAVEQATLVAGHGIAGDLKGRHDSRQLNVMLAETVAELRDEGFKTAPGELGEQIVISGLAIGAAVPGARIRLGGSALIELVYPRVPCGRFARLQGHSKDAARGRIGFMARVIAGGQIAVGSPVTLEQPPAPSVVAQTVTG